MAAAKGDVLTLYNGISAAGSSGFIAVSVEPGQRSFLPPTNSKVALFTRSPSSHRRRTPLASGYVSICEPFRSQDSATTSKDNPGPCYRWACKCCRCYRGSALNHSKMPWLPLMSCVLQECPHWLLIQRRCSYGFSTYTGQALDGTLCRACTTLKATPVANAVRNALKASSTIRRGQKIPLLLCQTHCIQNENEVSL